MARAGFELFIRSAETQPLFHFLPCSPPSRVHRHNLNQIAQFSRRSGRKLFAIRPSNGQLALTSLSPLSPRSELLASLNIFTGIQPTVTLSPQQGPAFESSLTFAAADFELLNPPSSLQTPNPRSASSRPVLMGQFPKSACLRLPPSLARSWEHSSVRPMIHEQSEAR